MRTNLRPPPSDLWTVGTPLVGYNSVEIRSLPPRKVRGGSVGCLLSVGDVSIRVFETTRAAAKFRQPVAKKTQQYFPGFARVEIAPVYLVGNSSTRPLHESPPRFPTGGATLWSHATGDPGFAPGIRGWAGCLVPVQGSVSGTHTHTHAHTHRPSSVDASGVPTYRRVHTSQAVEMRDHSSKLFFCTGSFCAHRKTFT